MQGTKEFNIDYFKMKRNQEEKAPVPYKDHYFDFDSDSQKRLQGVLNVLDGTPTTLTWTTADDSSMDIGAEDIKAIFTSAMLRSDALHTKYRLLRDKVLNATTQEEINELEW